jgi:hypothetical protein
MITFDVNARSYSNFKNQIDFEYSGDKLLHLLSESVTTVDKRVEAQARS